MGYLVITRAHSLHRAHAGRNMAVDVQSQFMSLRCCRCDPFGRDRGVEFRARQAGFLDLANRCHRLICRCHCQGTLRGKRILAIDDDGDLTIGREQLTRSAAFENAQRFIDHRSRAAEIGDTSRHILQQVPIIAADMQVRIPQTGNKCLPLPINPDRASRCLDRSGRRYRFHFAILDKHRSAGQVAPRD